MAKYTICGIEISEERAGKLARVIYNILTQPPVREKDLDTIQEMRKIMI